VDARQQELLGGAKGQAEKSTPAASATVSMPGTMLQGLAVEARQVASLLLGIRIGDVKASEREKFLEARDTAIRVRDGLVQQAQASGWMLPSASEEPSDTGTRADDAGDLREEHEEESAAEAPEEPSPEDAILAQLRGELGDKLRALSFVLEKSTELHGDTWNNGTVVVQVGANHVLWGRAHEEGYAALSIRDALARAEAELEAAPAKGKKARGGATPAGRTRKKATPAAEEAPGDGSDVPVLNDVDFSKGWPGCCYVCGMPANGQATTSDALGDAHNGCLNDLPERGKKKREKLLAQARAEAPASTAQESSPQGSARAVPGEATPGPWEVQQAPDDGRSTRLALRVVAPVGQVVATVTFPRQQGPGVLGADEEGTARANARVLAASSTMAAELVATLSTLRAVAEGKSVSQSALWGRISGLEALAASRATPSTPGWAA
jgi:hypothetical protein